MSGSARRVASGVKQWLRRRGGPLGSIVGVRTARQEFVLTYDDGPDVAATPAILDALDERAARATFFVLMTRARRQPGIVREIRARGHEIALHGADHRPISRLTTREVMVRTRDAKDELEQLIAEPVRWMRPPYGRQSVRSFVGVRVTGLTPVVWSGSVGDSRPAAEDDWVTNALRGAAPGAILLAHDSYAGQADGGINDDPPTLDRAALARRVLDAYAERGLRALSLGLALENGTPIRGLWYKR